jgi:hypothetical protein
MTLITRFELVKLGQALNSYYPPKLPQTRSKFLIIETQLNLLSPKEFPSSLLSEISPCWRTNLCVSIPRNCQVSIAETKV